MNDTIKTQLPGGRNTWVFILLWLVTFVLYISAAKAGWVIDAVGFLYNLKHERFTDFINRTHSDDQSFYQVLTLQYYIGYKLWGMNMYMWSLLYITLQAINAYLVFMLSSRLFSDTGIRNGLLVPLVGALFFTICPHVSEVVICKAYYHYLQCFMFILLIMLWVQKYQQEQKAKYVWGSAILFLLSVFTLEIFFIIPFLVITLAVYYRAALRYDKSVFKKTLLNFVLPQTILLGIYFIAVLATYKSLHVHKIEVTESALSYLSKIPKYLFHVVLLGRFFTVADKNGIYFILKSPAAVIIFYGLLIGCAGYAIAKFKSLSAEVRLILLFSVWSLMLLAFVVPLSFPGFSLLVFYDRYTYFANAFVYMAIAMLALRLKNKYVAYGAFVIYGILNLFFTVMVNDYWKQSDTINTTLLNNLPETGNKTVLLLNIPENMNGVPMIGAQSDGEYKTMHEVYTGRTLTNKIYDVASYNMTTDTDGVYVIAVNDSTIDVALGQWGSWWWYEGHGAKNYETADYKVNMINPSRWYQLTLKKPSSEYALLYNVGNKWKVMDMSKEIYRHKQR